MTRQTYDLEIITPCFCAGADPSQAEIRAPSIRGQLRWWFRVLGGSAKDEATLFGSVAGDQGTASAIRIAITDFKKGPIWNPPAINQNSAENYTWHFASASGKPANAGPHIAGPRWQHKGAIPPCSTFTLVVTHLRAVDPDLQSRLDLAINAFLCFGTIGLRATRGLGAFACKEAKQWRDMIKPLSEHGFIIALREQPSSFPSWEAALRDWSAWLRYKLRKERKADRFSALGGIQPRQASAVRFRPIKLLSGQFTWLALEAPHDKVLGTRANTILSTTLFQGQAPAAPPRKR